MDYVLNFGQSFCSRLELGCSHHKDGTFFRTFSTHKKRILLYYLRELDLGFQWERKHCFSILLVVMIYVGLLYLISWNITKHIFCGQSCVVTRFCFTRNGQIYGGFLLEETPYSRLQVVTLSTWPVAMRQSWEKILILLFFAQYGEQSQVSVSTENKNKGKKGNDSFTTGQTAAEDKPAFKASCLKYDNSLELVHFKASMRQGL